LSFFAVGKYYAALFWHAVKSGGAPSLNIFCNFLGSFEPNFLTLFFHRLLYTILL